MLFSNIQEIKKHTEVGAISFAALTKSIRLAEIQYIKPVIGTALYNTLTTAYAASPATPLSAPFEKLLFLIREALGPLASYIYIPKAEVQLTDAGALRAETANNKSAFQYQVNNQRAQLFTEGIMMTEELLAFLETNKADYTDWTGSNEFKKYRSLFIKTAGEFDLLFSSATPYRNYYFMRSVMSDVEELLIKKAIGTPQYTALKTKDALANPGFTDEEMELLRLLKHSIAHYTVSKAIPRLAVTMDAQGITVMTTSAHGTDDALGKKTAAADNQLSQLQRQSETDGGTWLGEALDYLKATASNTVFVPWYNEQLAIAEAAAARENNERAECEGSGTPGDFSDSANMGISGGFTL